MKGEWEPDEDIHIQDPLRTSDEEWEKMYHRESQGRQLMVAGGLILIFDLLFNILKEIGDCIEDAYHWINKRRKK